MAVQSFHFEFHTLMINHDPSAKVVKTCPLLISDLLIVFSTVGNDFLTSIFVNVTVTRLSAVKLDYLYDIISYVANCVTLTKTRGFFVSLLERVVQGPNFGLRRYLRRLYVTLNKNQEF